MPSGSPGTHCEVNEFKYVIDSLKIKNYVIFSQTRLDFDWGLHTSFSTLYNLVKNNPYVQ